MFLADATPTLAPLPAIVSTLDGVTTVLVAFLFVCLAMPTMVKNRPQWYMALAAVVGVIVLHVLSLMMPSFLTLFTVGVGALQIVALLLLVLCVGGLTAKQLAGDMARAYEVMRRGETEKEVIIPIGDQVPGSRRGRQEPPQKVYRVDSPPARPAVRDDEDDDSIPIA